MEAPASASLLTHCRGKKRRLHSSPPLFPRHLSPLHMRSGVPQENGLPGYEQLYHDSLRRRRKLEALAAQPHEEATFHPKVRGIGTGHW